MFAPLSRAASASATQFMRSWAVTRYPGHRYHEHMAQNLAMTTARPAYSPAVADYTPLMLPMVDAVVARAKVCARKVPAPRSASTEGTSAVLHALQQRRKPAPDMRYARR